MRDYKEYPLKRGEKPNKDDLMYWYIELNLGYAEIIEKYLPYKSKSSIQSYLKFYNIKKPKELKNIKRVETTLNKYGVSNVLQSSKIKTKAQQTNIERYGGISPTCSAIIKDKIRNTNKIKYGVDSISQLPEIKEKTKQTCMERYGVKAPTCSETIKEKIKQTCLEKYGVDNVVKCEDVKNKIIQTCLEKYGVDTPLKSDIVKEKVKQTTIDRYGVDNINHYNISTESLEILKDKQKLIEYFEYNRTKSRKIVAEKLGVSLSMIDTTLRYYGISNDYKMGGTSSYEEELVDYIKTFYNNEILRNQRILHRKEIDIYLPDIKFGIEFNGDYWHSEIVLMKKGYNPETYHIDKFNIAKQKGIYLHHIYEHEYNSNRQVVLDILKNLIIERI